VYTTVLFKYLVIFEMNEKAIRIGFCQIHKINVLRLHVVKEIQQKGNKLAFVEVSRFFITKEIKISFV